MKKLFVSVILLIVLVIIIVIGYLGTEVIKARNYTREVIIPRLGNKLQLRVEDLSARQMKILLEVEDPNFYNHNRIDLRTPGAGITTITQGLGKRYYFSRFRPGLAKIKLMVVSALALDSLVSKNDQLTLFLNDCYLGSIEGKNVIGFANAAMTYYKKNFQDLTEDEFISLVAMIIAPKTFNLVRYPDRNADRVSRIKKVISGGYVPKGLFDLYYGALPADIRDELPKMSYFNKYYQ